MPTLLHGPGCNLAEWYGMPSSCALLCGFAIGARVALLWQHYGNAWQSPAVIRQAHRTLHAWRTRTLRMPAKTPLAGDKNDAPAACAVPFRPYCGVVMRTRNVSEYMLVLALCLVNIIIYTNKNTAAVTVSWVLITRYISLDRVIQSWNNLPATSEDFSYWHASEDFCNKLI